MKLTEQEPEDPDESLWMLIEDLWEAKDDLRRMHLKFQCRLRGRQKYGSGNTAHKPYSGCPKCKAKTGNSFAGWEIEEEIDYLCNGGDPTLIPDFRGMYDEE